MKRTALRLIEQLFGVRVYRDSLPRGTDLFVDVDRQYGAHNFRTVFDVGANVGQSSLAYDRMFPNADIYAFEPVRDTFERLQRNTAPHPRIKAFHSGFGSTPADLEIHLHEDSKINSILFHPAERTETVSIQTVDAFADAHGVDLIDFMKIDTEGYEFEVLDGARRLLETHRVGMLYIEAEPYETDRHFAPFARLAAYLADYDYHLFGIYEQQPNWNGEKSILFFNPVFVCSELVPANVSPAAYPLRRRIVAPRR